MYELIHFSQVEFYSFNWAYVWVSFIWLLKTKENIKKKARRKTNIFLSFETTVHRQFAE